MKDKEEFSVDTGKWEDARQLPLFILEYINGMALVFNPGSFEIVYANNSFASHFGARTGSLLDFVVESSRKECREHIQAVLAEQQTGAFTIEMQVAGDFYEISTELLQDGNDVMLMRIRPRDVMTAGGVAGEKKTVNNLDFDDATANHELIEAKKKLEIKVAELEKVNNEMRLYKQTMLDKDEFLNQGTWEWDIMSNHFEYSRGMYRLFGYYSREEMKIWDSKGKDFTMHIDAEEQKRSDEDWVKILSEADTYLREMEITTFDGAKRRLETFGKVFRDENGTAYKVIGTTRDITQLKEYEQELEVKINELNRSNKDLEEFAYIASHDLHEPLRKLSTFGQRLEQSAQHELSPVNMDYLNRMLKATENMRNLIDNLLEFSRVTRGSDAYSMQDLGKIIEEVVSEQELRIEETGARITIDQMPELEVIAPQIKQLFNNLLNNALKFISKDGHPEIRFSCRKLTEQERSRHKLKPGRDYYNISVVDNGIGFENIYAEKIFQIFQRMHGRSDYAGSGIGLAICRKIAEKHQGLIFAESEPGKGSSFMVILPNKP